MSEIPSFYAVDPATGQGVRVVRADEVDDTVIRDAALGVDDVISEASFLRNSPLTGERLDLTYRQGARDAIAAIRETLGLAPAKFPPLEPHYYAAEEKERAILRAAESDRGVRKALEKAGAA